MISTQAGRKVIFQLTRFEIDTLLGSEPVVCLLRADKKIQAERKTRYDLV